MSHEIIVMSTSNCESVEMAYVDKIYYRFEWTTFDNNGSRFRRSKTAYHDHIDMLFRSVIFNGKPSIHYLLNNPRVGLVQSSVVFESMTIVFMKFYTSVRDLEPVIMPISMATWTYMVEEWQRFHNKEKKKYTFSERLLRFLDHE